MAYRFYATWGTHINAWEEQSEEDRDHYRRVVEHMAGVPTLRASLARVEAEKAAAFEREESLDEACDTAIRELGQARIALGLLSAVVMTAHPDRAFDGTTDLLCGWLRQDYAEAERLRAALERIVRALDSQSTDDQAVRRHAENIARAALNPEAKP